MASSPLCLTVLGIILFYKILCVRKDKLMKTVAEYAPIRVISLRFSKKWFKLQG